MLNEDGTEVVDGDEAPIPTYQNEDVVTHAKAWTGFVPRALRGNQEVRHGIPHNAVDHLFVEAAWRDVTPKMDLFKGHIGDGIPLCTDMPDRLFLRAGAQPLPSWGALRR